MDTILLVEANAKHADILRQQLEKRKFNVHLCSTASQAIEGLGNQSVCCLMVDLNMPEAQLWEFYRWIRETPRISDIPRLFLAGQKQAGIAGKLKKEHGEIVLNKPVEISKLAHILEKQKEAALKSLKSVDIAGDYLSSLIGKKIGPAVIREEIGRGGMGAVFLGYQESLKREVAVKLLLPDKAGELVATERFQREAQATARLKSPYIVQIFDFAQWENHTFYIVMEYLPGETVDKYLKRSGRFPLEKAISVVSQVAKGLSVAHDAGLIHRDIKPSNLIMNNKGQVTITDFGLVKQQKSVTQTQAGMIFGTPQYISPEQVGGRSLDSRSDIYSLGIVFYQLLTGSPPFFSKSAVEMLMKHINEPIPNLESIIPEIPPRLNEIILRMTAKDPSERYINCRELLWELEALERELASSKKNRDEVPLTLKSKISMNTSFNQGFLTLQNHFPSVFTPDRLQGAMKLSESGSVLDQQGNIPDRWKNTIHVFYESMKQLNTAAKLGKWNFMIINTPEEIVTLFPQGTNLGTMLFKQKDQTLSSLSLKKQAAAARTGKAAADPIPQISSIAGVIDVFLFNVEGQLTHNSLKKDDAAEQYKLRFAPVVHVIHALPVEVSDIDIWFERGRILIWKLNNGILFLLTSLDVSKSFLSIFISTHQEQLETATQTFRLPGVEKTGRAQAKVADPVSAELMRKIQLELARVIGPIAKVVLSKAIKKLGYSSDNFPDKKVSALIKALSERVDASKRQRFIDNVQDVIYEYRRKK